MICPYRKKVITENFPRIETTKTTELYAECFGVECPLYIPKGVIGHNEYCSRAEKENKNK